MKKIYFIQNIFCTKLKNKADEYRENYSKVTELFNHV